MIYLKFSKIRYYGFLIFCGLHNKSFELLTLTHFLQIYFGDVTSFKISFSYFLISLLLKSQNVSFILVKEQFLLNNLQFSIKLDSNLLIC